MNKQSFLFTALLGCMLFQSSCLTVTIPDPEEILGEASMRAEINGESFAANGILVSGELTESNASVQTLAIGAAELPIGGLTRGLVLAVVSSDGSGIVAGTTYSASSTTGRAAGEYTLDDDQIDVKAVSANTEVATITITDIDFDQQLVSGTFSFDGVDENDPTTIYEVREGVFTDVSFD
ncbi:MAG: DUF6252 family protein [Bacteroidota bacterium]